MATITAIPGIKTAFSGGADVIECTFSPLAKNGVQVETQGFTLNGATVEAYGGSSTDPDELSFTEAKHVAVISSAAGVANVGKVSISAVTAGSYFVTFSPL